LAYINIDVEGAEQLVLAGSEQLLQDAPPLVWSFEWLDIMQRLGSSPEALLEAFAYWDYRFFLYRPHANRLVSFEADASAVDRVVRRMCGLE
jgi:hypothetical protein